MDRPTAQPPKHPSTKPPNRRTSHPPKQNILGNAFCERGLTLLWMKYICVWKCRYLLLTAAVSFERPMSPGCWNMAYSVLRVYPSCTSFAFNHVERREKQRLVFAKSFSACRSPRGRRQESGGRTQKGCSGNWVCLSLIINNENGGVKSSRCSMPNAGICHSWAGKGFAF